MFFSILNADSLLKQKTMQAKIKKQNENPKIKNPHI